MLYNEYGTTGLSVSRIGFGGMRFDDIENKEVCAELVKSAYDAGINYFDTAIGYFDGKSEERFGLAFQEMKKTRKEKPFYVSTKTMAADPDTIRRNCETSLERLGVDTIDFYHVWYLTSLEEYKGRKAKGVIRGFEKLREEGLIRNISVSSHLPGNEVGQLLEDYTFAGVLLGYSAMNYKFREKALEIADHLNRGVVVMNPLGGGTIPNHPELFSFLQTRPEETVVEGAVRFLLNDPRINVTLLGLGNQSHLKDAIKAVDGFKPLSKADLNQVKNGLSGAMDRICTGCGYCLKDCPEVIPIASDMLSFNSYLLNNQSHEELIDVMTNGYRVMDNDRHGLDRCIDCKACEEACTQHLPIMERFEIMRKVLAEQKK